MIFATAPQVPTLILDIGLMAILVVVAFAIVRLRSLFAIVMLQGVYSLVCAAWFVSLDAVDVAFTEAAVGAGVSTVLMLAAMLLVDRQSNAVPVSKQIAPLLIVFVAAFAMLYAVPDMPAYGAADSPANSYVGKDYLERSAEETHVPNVVTAVLASYRGYDTFGEAVVIFAAGLGVFLLLGFNGNAGGWRASPNGQRISAPAAPFAHRDRPQTPPKPDVPSPSTTHTAREEEGFSDIEPENVSAPQPAPVKPTPAAQKTRAKKAPAKKKTTVKKPAAKKAAPKKTTPKKTTAKKAAPKKTDAKKAPAKKAPNKKPAAQRGPGRPRKTPAKKPTLKKGGTS